MPRRRTTIDDPALGPLTDDRLTADVRVYQRARGHRFSSDDVATAFVAFHARPEARRVCDLGTGLGSVLLTLAWKLPHAELWGIEAQEASFELLRRNVARSGMGERISIELGDLRDASALGGLDATMDLVTGTPPYFPPDTALDAADAQRAYARIEYRGGVEAYLATASRLVAADGVVVICGDARAAGRVERAAAPLGLAIVGDCPIVAQAGKPPLFALWTLAREGRPRREATLTLRTETGERTADAEALRVFSGFSGRSEG